MNAVTDLPVPRASKRWDQRLFTLLWAWLAFRTLLPWLVTYRLTLEGNTYSWGAEYFGRMFHSSGLARPDFLIVYALLAVSVLILWQLRQHHFRIAAPALAAFMGFFAANAAYQWLAGEPMMFHGDTLNIHVNLSVPIFAFNVGFFALAVLWWWGVRDVSRGPGPRPMSRVRRAVLWLCIAATPVQVILLMSGEPHALTDEIGVLMTLAQGALLGWALFPGNAYRP